MRLFNTAVCLSGLAYLMACANVSSPTGGPRDETPPALLSSVPKDNSTNVRSKEVVLEFDEYVRLDGINKQLIITPRIDIPYKSQVRKNIVTLSFEDPLPENTTFTLSFREAVKDITEGNPAENLTLAFSTGPFIDSLTLEGQVKDLLTDKPLDKVIVGLYPVEDTITIFNGKPYYFTQADATGSFRLQNLKQGDYNIYAWTDKNENLQLDSKNESYAYQSDPFSLNNSDTLATPLSLVQLDYKELKTNYARPVGKYYEVKFNKGITDYTATYPEGDSLVSVYKPSQNLIRWYTDQRIDSTRVILQVSDSLTVNALSDTLFIKFNESSRSRPEAFSYSVKPTDGKITRTPELILTFTKPVMEINRDKILLQFDSLNRIETDSVAFKWESNRTRLLISPQLYERPLVKYDSSNSPLMTLPDSTSEEDRAVLKRSIEQFNNNSGKTFQIILDKGAFISLENDSSEIGQNNYTFSKPEEYGIIAGTIDTEKKNYIVQLLDANQQIVKEAKNVDSFRFSEVPPGDYTIRVLIDENGNAKWDAGNIMLKEQPEQVYFYEKTIPLKANWEVVDEKLTF